MNVILTILKTFLDFVFWHNCRFIQRVRYNWATKHTQEVIKWYRVSCTLSLVFPSDVTLYFYGTIAKPGHWHITVTRVQTSLGYPQFLTCIPLCTRVSICTHAKSFQSCLTLCEPMDCSPPGSSVHVLQARILEWVAMPSSKRSSQPRDQSQVSPNAGRFFTSWATREALNCFIVYLKLI